MGKQTDFYYWFFFCRMPYVSMHFLNILNDLQADNRIATTNKCVW